MGVWNRAERARGTIDVYEQEYLEYYSSATPVCSWEKTDRFSKLIFKGRLWPFNNRCKILSWSLDPLKRNSNSPARFLLIMSCVVSVESYTYPRVTEIGVIEKLQCISPLLLLWLSLFSSLSLLLWLFAELSCWWSTTSLFINGIHTVRDICKHPLRHPCFPGVVMPSISLITVTAPCILFSLSGYVATLSWNQWEPQPQGKVLSATPVPTARQIDRQRNIQNNIYDSTLTRSIKWFSRNSLYHKCV